MKKLIPIVAGLIMAAGVIVLMYPAISNYIAKRQQENVIVGYEESVKNTEDELIDKEWEKAYKFQNDHEMYEEILNIEGNGVMGYLEIPKLKISIPIYHHANDESLKKGIGHLENTDFPIGGEGNRPVLLGHRGVPTSEIFTRLDELRKGDIFFIHVLDEILQYKVNDIQIVIPEEVKKIIPVHSEDLVTLVTCTPYGVNTHRLIVTGKRNIYIENGEDRQEVEKIKYNKYIIFVIVIFAGLIVILFPVFTHEVYTMNTRVQRNTFRENDDRKINAIKLYNELKYQNEQLFLNRQDKLTNEEAYRNAKINLKVFGLDDNIIGYISIPKMKIILPIILGASEENMKKGAVHLTETSYPIGGENTNCVIAAHRGYSKTAMFRDIEKLSEGNEIYIDNFKERLRYKVTKTKVILPSDIEEIKIVEGKDMLTLITCHPYRKNSNRYIVFCERM